MVIAIACFNFFFQNRKRKLKIDTVYFCRWVFCQYFGGTITRFLRNVIKHLSNYTGVITANTIDRIATNGSQTDTCTQIRDHVRSDIGENGHRNAIQQDLGKA
jgi:hypothetical protein